MKIKNNKKTIILIDGFAGSGKGFYFNLLAKKINCYPIPTHDGLIELLKNKRKITSYEIKNHLNKYFVFEVAKNQQKDLYLEIPVPKFGSVKEKIKNFYFPPYHKIVNTNNLTKANVLNTIFPESDKPYLIMGQSGIGSKDFLIKFGFNVILIHTNRSAYSCMCNLVSRVPLNHTPISKLWARWNWSYFFIRGYPASIIYINYRLSKEANLTINWPNIMDIKKIFKIYINKDDIPLDNSNKNPFWFNIFVLITIPIMFLKIILKRFN